MVKRLSFEDQITRNKIRSILLMTSVIIVFLLIGYTISMLVDPSFFFIIMMFSIMFSVSYTIFGYYSSDKIALASVRATPASRHEHRMFFDVAENMAIASGLPQPRLFVMNSPEINAFASGRDPAHAVICVTTGALDKLTKQELEGVVAHEMAHIANFDIRFMTLSAILIGMIAILSELFLRSLWFSNEDERNKQHAFLIIAGIVLAILAPLLSQLVSFAISRKREFLADATGVKLTRYPPGLASALKKIKHEHTSPQDRKVFPKALAPLFISDPLKKLSNVFATHPPIEERIRRLEMM